MDIFLNGEKELNMIFAAAVIIYVFAGQRF
jgi:hypothetical protein